MPEIKAVPEPSERRKVKNNQKVIASCSSPHKKDEISDSDESLEDEDSKEPGQFSMILSDSSWEDTENMKPFSEIFSDSSLEDLENMKSFPALAPQVNYIFCEYI